MKISANIQQDTPTVKTFSVPGIKAGDYVGVSIATNDVNLRYSSYCDTDDEVKVVLNYVPTEIGPGTVDIVDAEIAFSY